jgi:hypothetical protein
MTKTHVSLLVVALCLTGVVSMSATDSNVLTNPQVSRVAPVDLPSLSERIATQPQDSPFGYHQASPVQYPKLQQLLLNEKLLGFTDKSAQQWFAPATIANVVTDWLGVGVGFYGYQVPDAPTDGQIAIGDSPCQVVQWVNVQFAVFDCNGVSLTYNGQHFSNGNILWPSGPCAATNSGDIVVQFDKIAHRWVMYQPRFTAPYYDCFAVSKTGDFMGGWWTYAFPTYDNANDFPDYPKVGVWPDGYYVSHNSFFQLQNYNGAMPCAYGRVAMLNGQPANGVCFLDNSNGTLFDDSMLPSDLDSGNNLPPAGAPNLFFGSIDNFAQDSNVYYYKFHFDPVNPANSTFSCINGTCKIPVTVYQNAAANAAQPGGAVINTLSDRLMNRAAYRVLPGLPVSNNLTPGNTVQNWLMSHAVNSNGHAAVRWYEFRAPSGSTTPTVYQQGTYDPDSTNRFMSSLAMDKKGNIAMSYTVSSTTVNPTIAFTGRNPGTGLGQMGAEQVLVVGTGHQTDTANRWGDYYNMAVSPDGCTFATTGQYYINTGSFAWSTRNALLKFSGCQ